MKWEYMCINYFVGDTSEVEQDGGKHLTLTGSRKYLIQKLDEFGENGWEVVSFTQIEVDYNLILLKRQL